MRELKFRAWDTKDKCWMYGYETLGGFSLIGEVTLMGELGRPKLEKLLTDIVFMQYTELKDMNGNEIYEGDILKAIPGNGYKFGAVGRVMYVSDYGGFAVIGQYHRNQHHNLLNCDVAIETEVIGNIYENPDLIN